MNRLVAVCGLPGTGKTTVAEEIAARLDAALLRTDVVRKDLYDEPRYTEAETAAVYDELLDRGIDALDTGDVVLDATFRTTTYRERARRRAHDAGAEFCLVSVECRPEVARDRIRERSGDVSDADVGVYDELRDGYDPVTDADLVVDNSGPRSETFAQLDGVF